MRVLAIDTCFDACSVALFDAARDEVLAERSEPMARGHAEALFGLIAETSRASGTALDAVDRIAVTIGPGSFTGVRVGLAAARGLALAAEVPLVGITSLEVMAKMAAPARTVAAVHDAKRGEVFVEVHGPAGRLLEAASHSLATAADAIGAALLASGEPAGPLVLTGSAAEAVAPDLGGRGREIEIVPVPKHLSATLLGELAAIRPDPAKHGPRRFIFTRPMPNCPAASRPSARNDQDCR